MCALPAEGAPNRARPNPIQWIALAVVVLLLLEQLGLFRQGGAGILARGPAFFVPFLIAIVIAVTVHEFSHALVATLFGDQLPRSEGRLTLNPLRHLDPLGSLLFLIAGFGWGRPVPIDPGAMRNPSLGWALSSVAGPVSNLALASLTAVAVVLIGPAVLGSGGLQFAQRLIELNAILAVFNLLPLPPLDGFGFVFGLSPRPLKLALLPIQRYGPWLLLGLVFLPRLVPGFPPILGAWIETGVTLFSEFLGVLVRAI